LSTRRRLRDEREKGVHLTKKASYGLIAALELAANTDAGPLSAGTIAEKYALPAPFMEKILHQLRRSGLVAAQQGRGGGYTLIDDPPTVSVRKVLESLDESLDLVGCIRQQYALRGLRGEKSTNDSKRFSTLSRYKTCCLTSEILHTS
jgi:Rrf2 family protein